MHGAEHLNVLGRNAKPSWDPLCHQFNAQLRAPFRLIGAKEKEIGRAVIVEDRHIASG